MSNGTITGPPTRLFLVRHGEVEGDGVIHGHVDVSLTARGMAQLEAVAARLAGEPLAGVYSSDLQRARVGAELVARGRGLPALADPAFRELDMGEWDARPFKKIRAEEGERIRAWWADMENYVLPGGESLGQLRSRVVGALTPLLERHRGESLCLVAHSGVNRIVLFDAIGVPLTHYRRLAQDYGCLNLIEYYPDGNAVVRHVNL
jgi:alpha-ribazole phosphatase